MNLEKYTDRARGFLQAAQSLALREGHQQFAPEHMLKVLLDDPEGLAAGLIDRSGGRSREALGTVEAALAAAEARAAQESAKAERAIAAFAAVAERTPWGEEPARPWWRRLTG